MFRLVTALCAAVALASPTPSPALSGVLAPPLTNDFTEGSASNSTLLEGQFDAKTYVTRTQVANADAVQQTLTTDGFVDGYWRTWIQNGTQHVLIEIVMAFKGGNGAKQWLGAQEVADKGDANYQSSLSISGIDTYYGAKFLYAHNHSYAEEYAFTKGNDFFVVIFDSPNDDLGTSTADQAKAQYSSAPAATIPRSYWPETATSAPPATSRSNAFATEALIAAIGGGLIGLGAVMVIRSRSRGA